MRLGIIRQLSILGLNIEYTEFGTFQALSSHGNVYAVDGNAYPGLKTVRPGRELGPNREEVTHIPDAWMDLASEARRWTIMFRSNAHLT